MIRGLCALKRGQVSGAEGFLLAAGRCAGSPQLNTFGPNMRLAAALLDAGSSEVVLQYLEDCKAFWEMETKDDEGKRVLTGVARLDQWATEVREGKTPDFGPNLAY
jgi:hypothetical protein